jgi:hypothetical protein
LYRNLTIFDPASYTTFFAALLAANFVAKNVANIAANIVLKLILTSWKILSKLTP